MTAAIPSPASCVGPRKSSRKSTDLATALMTPVLNAGRRCRNRSAAVRVATAQRAVGIARVIERNGHLNLMSTQVSTQALIPVDWVEHEVGQPQAVRVWAEKLGLECRRDEVGREWIAAPDGLRIVEEIRRAGREAAELHQAYEAYLEDWDRQQLEVGEEVFQRVLVNEHQRQAVSTPDSYAFVGNAELLAPGPRVHEFANREAAAAREAWARKHPRMDFGRFERKWKRGRR